MNHFDALIADLDHGRLALPAGQEHFLKADTFDNFHDKFANVLLTMDIHRAAMAPLKANKPSRWLEIALLRERLATSYTTLKSMVADGVIQRGEATAEQVTAAEAKIHTMHADLDRLQHYDPEAGPRPAPNIGMPDEVNTANFKPKMMLALHAGKITPMEACTTEARMIRGQAPDADVVRRVMAG